MVNFERFSARTSSVSVGRWEISMRISSFRGNHYLMPDWNFPYRTSCSWTAAPCGHETRPGSQALLRVVLDDQLLVQRHIDLRTLGELVHQDAEPVRDDLQPAHVRAVTDGLARHLERQRRQRLLLDIDDVVLRN